ncbi:class I SAM-dependent methyltransferase [Hoeflea prorocentri]|uniref:Class I SAM-dependent methyltransferase n=1 Tax=Hoeflea prorocentri TaxID=1922333 RepID=A0A9X3UEH6_9HYPH|nr:class I SAM-dependent methyltransferase [Hoeflea prorocentri]MCY6379847.1 class I SAM-dependent methyltransferase [Hoeflea prorocentri]MDA5397647.1 class I SAM-dependent methyltransferase [Hoeflea prorocentri]
MFNLDSVSKSELAMTELIADVEGWCTPHKACLLNQIAIQPDIHKSIEIGIYAGKSFFPVCAAYKEKGYGKHYGIEAWSNEVAIETVTTAVNDEWWSKVDIVLMKEKFLKKLLEENLFNYAAIVESDSNSAYGLFASARYEKTIDLLHIDGAHSVQQSLNDVVKWSSLVKPGGYIFLDDIDWPSVKLARTFLQQIGEEVYSISDPARSDHFSVFKLDI